MSTLEYHFEQISRPAMIIRRLNELGAEGWELVTVASVNYYIFKRAKKPTGRKPKEAASK